MNRVVIGTTQFIDYTSAEAFISHNYIPSLEILTMDNSFLTSYIICKYRSIKKSVTNEISADQYGMAPNEYSKITPIPWLPIQTVA
jgi:hypothetical protein